MRYNYYPNLTNPNSDMSSSKPLRHGFSWSEEETMLLLKAKKIKFCIKRIAQGHQRTQFAIHCKLIDVCQVNFNYTELGQIYED
jgi:hypothetical protein